MGSIRGRNPLSMVLGEQWKMLRCGCDVARVIKLQVVGGEQTKTHTRKESFPLLYLTLDQYVYSVTVLHSSSQFMSTNAINNQPRTCEIFIACAWIRCNEGSCSSKKNSPFPRLQQRASFLLLCTNHGLQFQMHAHCR